MKNDKLKFSKSKHVYSINGKELVSVTTLISRFKTEFNASMMSKIISRCIQKEFANSLGKDIYTEMPKFCKLFLEPEVMFHKLKEERQFKAAYVTPTMIKKIWKQKAKDSQEFGTEIHKALENFILNKPYAKYKYEKTMERVNWGIEYLENYKQDNQDTNEIFTPEFQVFSEDLGIAGTIDLLIDKRDGFYKISDWKSNEKIDKVGYKGQKMKFPINDTPDCSFYHYALQLSMYAFILEKEYDINVDEIEIVHLKDDCFEVIVLPLMRDECEWILATLKEKPIETAYGGVEI